MDQFATNIVESATVSALIAAALIWLTKSWIGEHMKRAIEHEYAQKLESHKAQLAAQNEVAIERTRSQLAVTAKEHEIRFSQFHAKAAEVIESTYTKLDSLICAVEAYVAIFTESTPPIEVRRKTVTETQREFVDYFNPRRIYFSKGVIKRIVELERRLRDAATEFADMVDSPDAGKDKHKHWVRAVKVVRDEAEPLFAQLQEQFQTLLGMPPDTATESQEATCSKWGAL